MAGDTLDNPLAGGINTIYNIPYVSLQSIAIGGKIYWAKAFSQKLW
jgi:hypothetical protein